MVENRAKTYVKIGFEALRKGQGWLSFMPHVVVAGSITFFALMGGMAMVLSFAIQDYGVDRGFGNVSGIEAITMLRSLMIDQAPLMLAAAGLWGVLSGLKNVGEKVASSGNAQA